MAEQRPGPVDPTAEARTVLRPLPFGDAPITGGLLFEMLSEPEPADPNAPKPRLGLRRKSGPPGRPAKGGASKGRPKPRGR